MAQPFSWTCPYCGQIVTITDSNTSHCTHPLSHGNKHDKPLLLSTSVIVCPNPVCREYEIRADLFTAFHTGSGYRSEAKLENWKLRPKSAAQAFPAYIPETIREDYGEACLIMNDSPKASATLARRCLQGMIRDFWGISKSRLVDEIQGLEGKIDATTWQAIDAVRKVGNIGAHMGRDIDLIVDVEPDEAQTLIGLIEFLLRDWYVARHEREEQKKKVIELANQKTAAKSVPATGGSTLINSTP